MLPDNKKAATMVLLLLAFLSYSFYLYRNLPVPHTSLNLNAEKGKMLWQKHNCTACHQIYGLGGFLGPDLTNTYSLKGVLYISTFLKSGNVIMPDFHLENHEIKSLIAYLRQIDSSGLSDPKTFKVNYNGSIEK